MEVSTRARVVPVALALVSLVVAAVRAVRGGQELVAAVTGFGALGAAAYVAYLWSRGRPAQAP
ncbi:hypothetical protein GCM10009576_099250 [Streptomyces rhizosphaericus]|uniref:Secreted protein n=1 Tax=Streptomyces rhizosphaericus TaxID=114699 RepID=A0ABP4DVG7_9ACTN